MSFDFGSATETQQEYLHRLAHNYTTPTDSDEWYFSDFLYPRPILWFFLTLDGERDVCEIGSITFKESEFDVSNRPTELLDSLPISYQEEVSVISYEDSDQNLPWWYICGDGAGDF